MKKLVLAAFLAAIAICAFGIDLSAGAGMTIGGFSQTTYFEPYTFILTFDSFKQTVTNTPFAFTVYFDATYAVATFGFRGNGSPHQTIVTVLGGSTNTNDTDIDERAGFVSFSLLGRYPFLLGPVSLFPLLGIEYDLNLYWKDAAGADLKASLTSDEKSWLNQFWFKAGVGADFFVYKGLYIRPLVLLGFKLLNQGEKDDIASAESSGATIARKTDFVVEAGVQAGWRF